jgi:Domain of unknown function (DUF4382)
MLKRLRPHHLLWIASGVGAALVLACGRTPGTPTTSSTVAVMITDSPFTDARALLVTFSEVSAHSSGGGWVTVPFSGGATSRTCDLTRLMNNAQDVLGVGALAPGHYTDLRLTVSSATIYFQTTTTGPTACANQVALSSSTETGTPVTVSSGQLQFNRQFDLDSGPSPTEILLDFNGNASVVALGNGAYRMTPVVAISSIQ